MSTNKTLIAKNTALLYLRIFLTVIVGLYTSRIVLSVLGEVDYGLFNLVGGVIGFLGFLNMALGASTQRFLNANRETISSITQSEIFTTSMVLHVFIGLIVCLMLETVGLWFVCNKLVIPESQFHAALVVYHISVISCFLGIITTPYSALINSHEKMGVYAYFSILDVVLRLLIVFLLVVIESNKLICYAILCLAVSIIMQIVYWGYCKLHFPECRLRKYFNLKLIKEMSQFSGWMIWGCIAVIFSNQGVTILINIFCGPVLNASRALAASVQGILYQFSNNILAASKPQITKQYNEADSSNLQELVNLTAKSTFFMILIPSVPIIIFTNQILELWLTVVPPMTEIFIKILIVDTLIRAIFEPMAIVNQAGGKVRLYQLTVTGFYLLQFLGAYLFLSAGFPAYYAYLSMLFCSLIGVYPRLKIVQRIDNYNILNFFKFTILPILKVIMPTILLFLLIYLLNLDSLNNLWGVGFSILSLIILTTCIIYSLGLTTFERKIIITKVHQLLKI